MVNIRDYLHDELIIANMRSGDKDGVIREFAELLQKAGKIPDAADLIKVLLDREALGSTGIGDGVAIPHGKLSGLRDVIIAFGKSDGGVDFNSMDGKPARLFFLLVTPEGDPGVHLRTLARISRILKNQALRDELQRASSREELKRLICEEDGRYSKNEF